MSSVSDSRNDSKRAQTRARHLAPEDLERYAEPVSALLAELATAPTLDSKAYHAILRRHPRPGHGMFSKNLLVRVYRHLCATDRMQPDETLLRRIQMKPTRTISGVAPVTVLTKPFPCPGKCIFCPTDARMPKSYLPDEPGAMRAEQHAFDPAAQVAGRIAAFSSNGHATDKIELLILGGTWSSYPRVYQSEFVQRCLDAMNGRASASLDEAQQFNENATHRNVGLVIETRPDHISPEEVRWLRSLGVTKVQMGAQSLDDEILRVNQRGHTVEHTRRAMDLLRAAGLKLVLHWMPNLLGATPQSDLADFRRLWDDPSLRPDEIKIYPCSLLKNAELYDVWKRGEYEPYTDDALIDLVGRCKELVPEYCRINRVVRDIPAPNVVEGCRLANLREFVRGDMRARGATCRCVRCREIRGDGLRDERFELKRLSYSCSASEERFLSFETAGMQLAGYLRLSLPKPGGISDRWNEALGIPELDGAAIVRELHVYGPALQLGAESGGRMQHRGLGSQLLLEAEKESLESGYERLAVIASVGTRRYYAERGYARSGSYLVKELVH